MTIEDARKLKHGASVQFWSSELDGFRWMPGIVEGVADNGKHVILLIHTGKIVKRIHSRVRRPQS